ncbi:MAG: hypothetical protein NDJ89_09275 [Oligoflexia bacterium]|nr:hypothetical protein [Oligoflexia bacterium]
MKKLVTKIALGLLILAAQAQAAQAQVFTLYCNTLVQLQAVTPSWVTHSVIDGGMKSMGYSPLRDAEFRFSDFKQTSVSASALNPDEAQRIAITSLCKAELTVLRSGLVERFGSGRAPLDAAIFQCGYVYDTAGNYIRSACPAIPALQVR